MRIRTGSMLLAGGLVAIATATSAPAHGQPPIEVVELDRMGCETAGKQAFCDGFYWGNADAEFGDLGAAQDGVQIDLSASFDSTFWLEVANQQTTGDWNINGIWKMIFSGSANGAPVSGVANVDMAGSGVASGDASRFTVEGTETNTGTADIGGRQFPISNSGALLPVDVELTGGTCVEVFGEWRMSWAALAAEVGWSGTDTITGDFVAIRQDQFDREVSADLHRKDQAGELGPNDIAESNLPQQMKDFTTNMIEFGRVLRSINSIDEPANDAAISRFLDIIAEQERLAAEIRNASACERELLGDTLVQITGWPARSTATMAEFLTFRNPTLSGEVIRQATETAIRTGAIGKGSTFPTAKQAAIEAALRTQIEQVFERNTEASSDGSLYSPDRQTELEVLAASRAAVLLGGDFDIHGTSGPVGTDFVEATEEVLYGSYGRDIRFLIGPKELTL